MENNVYDSRNINVNTKKRKSRKVNFRFFIFCILIIILIISFILKYKEYILDKLNSYINTNISSNIEDININPEEYANNDLYKGIGQEKVEGKDGYDTTFTSINGKVYKEYKQVGNASYKNNQYWGGTFEENGCGLAAISTILSGYNLNYTPEDLRKKYINFPGEHLEGDQMSNEFTNTFNLSNTDFLYADAYFKKSYIMNHLKEDRPILICVWNKPDSKWTTSSHYMCLLATDGEDKVYVSNPNGLYGKIKMSGWYNTSDVLPYIAKALFINE